MPSDPTGGVTVDHRADRASIATGELAAQRGIPAPGSSGGGSSALHGNALGVPRISRRPSTPADGRGHRRPINVNIYLQPGSSLAEELNVNVVAQTAVTALGDHNVIAHDGSIVNVGDNGHITGNTGDASQGSTVALDTQGSTFSSTNVASGAGRAGAGQPTTATSSAAAGQALGGSPGASTPASGTSSGVAAATQSNQTASGTSSGVAAATQSNQTASGTSSGVAAATQSNQTASGTSSGVAAATQSNQAASTGSAWSPIAWMSLAGLGVPAGFSPSAIPIDASPLVSAFINYTGNRTADIAGFEDHSVITRGAGNVVTYDDSNVFIDRDGKINANTGDTDSAGLNAVAVTRSVVRAGPHCDDGCDDESIIQAQAGVFDEGDVAVDGDGHVVWSPDTVDSDASSSDEGSDGDSEGVPQPDSCNDPAETNDDGCSDSLPSDNGDDDDSIGDESPDGDVSDPVEPAETLEEADSTRPAADNGPEPEGEAHPGQLTVGGDGIDDLSERVDGVGNVSTYDDSNVVIGGSGPVNAQIGDSDTGGTVAMDIVDSVVEGGDSR